MKFLTLALSMFVTLLPLSGEAAVNIFLVGANSDRFVTNRAIRDLFTGSSTFAYVGNDGPISYTQEHGVYSGTYSGTTVNVYVSFSGGVHSIRSLATYDSARFVPAAYAGTNTNFLADPVYSTHQLGAVDIALSDAYQSTTGFIGGSYPTLVDKKVSVVPLKWLGSRNFPGTNLTSQKAQLLFTTGILPLSTFTGTKSQDSKIVFAIGSHIDSAERMVALKESGLSANSVVTHFKPVVSGASTGVNGFLAGGTVISHDVWPIETVHGTQGSEFAGNAGAYKDNTLANALTAVLSANAYTYNGYLPSATGGYYIGYLPWPISDTNAIPNGAVELKWNGVQYSLQNLREGKYTFWAYQHLYYRSSLSAFKKTFADALASRLEFYAGLSNLKIDSNFKVSRSTDGGLVTPTYF